MNKRIYKKKHRAKKVNLNKLYIMAFDERVEYFLGRNTKVPPIGFIAEWESADFERRRDYYEPDEEDEIKLQAQLEEYYRMHPEKLLDA